MYGVVKGKDALAEDRDFVKELVAVKSHQNRTFQKIRSFILNNQNMFVSKPHCQDCLSDDRDPDQGSMGLDLPKTARQVSLSDDQIQLFFSCPTVDIRLVNRPSRPRGSSLSSANLVFYSILIEEWP